MLKKFANFVGAYMLPYSNARVVAPPGRVTAGGGPNIIIATPRRSGTHVAIDLILNNIPAYRRRPLYVNLDPMLRNSDKYRDDIDALIAGSGQLVKTHFPFRNAGNDQYIDDIIRASTVILVHRDVESVIRSLRNWQANATRGNLVVAETEMLRQEYQDFWDYWQARADHVVDFGDLFHPEGIEGLLVRCGRDPACVEKIRTPPPKTARMRIYANKALTRLLGKHAPKIDTSIFTGQ